MSDSSDIDQAIIAKLGSDAILLSHCVNGVFWDESPPNSTRFVIVSLITAFDLAQFGARAYEDVFYQIEARMLSTAGGNIKAAAARIDALLDDQPLTVTGYTTMTVHREERTRVTELDEAAPDIRWQRRGGRYRVQMSL